MTRDQLEHLIRAAAAIANEYEIMVVGSQSILGAVPDAPADLLVSMAADLYPWHRPDLADLIDGSIGELSPFQERFGDYAQGVGPETAILPAGWAERRVRVQNANTDLKIGWCLEPHDLAASKLAAGRDKDWRFVASLLSHGIVSPATLLLRIQTLPLPEARRAALATWASARAP
jgi:hypothetical protein